MVNARLTWYIRKNGIEMKSESCEEKSRCEVGKKFDRELEWDKKRLWNEVKVNQVEKKE